jgi:serine/threonine-protein kinase
MVLGTAAYMSPEQARGQAVDKRADIWAFGCVLYEMLTGRAAFARKTTTDTLAAVVEHQPDWTVVPAATPPHIPRLIQRCLEKDPKRRLRDIGDARIELSEREDSRTVPNGIAAPRRSPWRTALLVASVGAVAVVVTWRLAPRLQPRLVERALVSIAPAANFGRPSSTGLSLSPDGRQLVFSATSGEAGSGNSTLGLYLRPIDQLDARLVKGTEGASSPVFSPDGRAVAFLAGGKLMRVGLDGAPPVALASVSTVGQSVGLSWLSNGDVLFANSGRGLSRALADGSDPVPMTTPDQARGERHLFPFVLPGDRAILFTIVPVSGWDDAEIVVQSLSDGQRRSVIKGGVDARYVDPGYLVYLKSESLMAVRFDPRTQQVEGEPVALLEGIRVSLNAATTGGETSAGQFAVSRSGTLAYVGGGARPDRQEKLVWVDRDGAAQPLNAPTRPYIYPRLSPDGERIAVSSQHAGAADVWVYDISRGSLTRHTFRYSNYNLVWSPNGTRLAFSSTANGFRNVFWTKVDGRDAPERLTTLTGPSSAQDPSSWSPNGRDLLFTERYIENGTQQRAIMRLALGEHGPPSPWLKPQAKYEYMYPTFSPDGRYVAYASNETGPWEIYIRPFDGDGRLVQVSNAGGTEPLWAPRGVELFYRNDDRVLVVEVSTAPVLTIGKPRDLFSGPYAHAIPARDYDVTADGKRFLMVQPAPEVPEPPATHITVVINWIGELEEKLKASAR